jgi:hypothetical protein
MIGNVTTNEKRITDEIAADIWEIKDPLTELSLEKYFQLFCEINNAASIGLTFCKKQKVRIRSYALAFSKLCPC